MNNHFKAHSIPGIGHCSASHFRSHLHTVWRHSDDGRRWQFVQNLRFRQHCFVYICLTLTPIQFWPIWATTKMIFWSKRWSNLQLFFLFFLGKQKNCPDVLPCQLSGYLHTDNGDSVLGSSFQNTLPLSLTHTYTKTTLSLSSPLTQIRILDRPLPIFLGTHPS